jgi:hypothetical protein
MERDIQRLNNTFSFLAFVSLFLNKNKDALFARSKRCYKNKDVYPSPHVREGIGWKSAKLLRIIRE